MQWTIMKLILIAIAALFYYFVFSRIKSNTKNSRAANFSVGGRKRYEKELDEMTREERVKNRKVSLREGRMLRRRGR